MAFIKCQYTNDYLLTLLFIICAVLIIKSFHTQLSLLRSRSAYDKVIYCQSFLQTGSYVLYFIIWTCGEIVKQNVTMHI